MANNDWDLDDLLDFHFDREVPEKSSKIDDIDNERKLYEELRRKSKGSSAPAFDVPEPVSNHKWIDEDSDIFAQYDREHAFSRMPDNAPVEEVDERPHRNIKEIEAIKQASQEAYDRYRSNYTKNKNRNNKKSSGRRKVNGFHKGLTTVYTIAFGIFAASMIFMNVLPFGMSAAMFAVLILLSLVIYVQTRSRKSKNWGKLLATFAAMLLIVFYGVGTAYALGTLSFLSGSSVKNTSAVSDVTKHPFNFIITGIDVDGTIDAEGRSDVNMVVTVNPKTHQILMTSIPRDYEIYMAEFDNAMDKLTHTGFYGVQTTIDAEEQLFDTDVNYYVKVNFTTVERFIDAIGGVDVESEYEFTPVKLKEWTVKKGVNHMNGKQALAFARERKAFPTGDHQRIKNQQLVFEALIKKATSSRTMILSYNKVLSSLRNYFEMSFSSREIRKLVKFQLAKDPSWKIFKNSIVGGDGMLPTYSSGGEYAYVMTQDPESIENAKTLMNAVLGGQDLQTDEDGVVTVVSGE
ncbi:MAG: LCP family protein [Mogibacterium sp.]|nr:LCP family protein [Mogibacterium sp.]MBQ6500161.1 LCP family protein [Mogibacterium sp.]